MHFWIKTPIHPCTSHPLHSLVHNIYFHHLPFSLLSLSSYYPIACFFTIPVELQIFCLASGIEHGWVYVNVGGVTISDPENCYVTVGVMFWFAYVSVVFFYSWDLHEEETMVFEAHGMSFPCTELLLFNYAKVKTVFHSMAPLTKVVIFNMIWIRFWFHYFIKCFFSLKLIQYCLKCIPECTYEVIIQTAFKSNQTDLKYPQQNV